MSWTPQSGAGALVRGREELSLPPPGLLWSCSFLVISHGSTSGSQQAGGWSFESLVPHCPAATYTHQIGVGTSHVDRYVLLGHSSHPGLSIGLGYCSLHPASMHHGVPLWTFSCFLAGGPCSRSHHSCHPLGRDQQPLLTNWKHLLRTKSAAPPWPRGLGFLLAVCPPMAAFLCPGATDSIASTHTCTAPAAGSAADPLDFVTAEQMGSRESTGPSMNSVWEARWI